MASRRKRRPTISEQLRKAITASGLSRCEIAKQSGIEQSALSRFMSGERGLSTSTLDKLADALGLEVVSRGPKKS